MAESAAKITANTAEVKSLLGELSLLLLGNPDLPADQRQHILHLLDLGWEVGGVETISALGATELRFKIKLADGLREVTSALRTRNSDPVSHMV